MFHFFKSMTRAIASIFLSATVVLANPPATQQPMLVGSTVLAPNTYNAVTNWSSSKFLGRTPASNSNQQKLTISMWVKRTTAPSTLQALFVGSATIAASPIVYWTFGNALVGSNNLQDVITGATTQAVSTNTFASTTSWYHLVLAIDTTQATAANRQKMYINGVQETMTGATYALNDNINVNITTRAVQIGYQATFGSCTCKIAYITYVDGAQLTPSDFSQAGVGGTVPKAYTGSFGTNGWLLDFSNTSSLGTDSSGNGNTLSVNSLTSGDASSENVFY